MFKKKSRKAEKRVDDLQAPYIKPTSSSLLDQRIQETVRELDEIKKQLALLQEKSQLYFNKLEKLDKLKHGRAKIEAVYLLEMIEELRKKEIFDAATLDEIEKRILDLIQ